MDLDAKRFTDGAVMEADLCVIGAGPAGLVLASELARRGRDVMLLESGGDRPDPDVLGLNDGDVVGDAYAGLRETRHRQIGGLSSLWNTPVRGSVGAKYVPLDAVDLEVRPPSEPAGWPLSYSELCRFYERAQMRCGLGPFRYEAAAWARPGLAPLARIGPHLVSRVYQVGARDALVPPIISELRRSGNARLCTNATAVRLETDASGRRVMSAVVASPGGPRWRLRARRFVLAAGAVENARLLLASGSGPEGLGNDSGWVGRGFMEHPRDSALVLDPRAAGSYGELAFYDLHEGAEGALFIGRLALVAEAVRSGELPNASATLLPRVRPTANRAHAALAAAGLRGAARRWLPSAGHGWSRTAAPARTLDGFAILLNLEQQPHPDNRVALGARRDALAVPVPVLHWRWRAEEQLRLERLRAVVRRELEGAGLGRVRERAGVLPDPNARHHAGTTRMSEHPRDGVVDAAGRVHSLDNVSVAGASVFPTSGYANPMLTIVALSLRLAEDLDRAG